MCKYSASLDYLLVLLFCCTVIAGCSGNDKEDMIAAANDNNVKRLAHLYGFFQIRNNFKGPESEEEFKAFIKSMDQKRLERMGVTVSDVDSLFISERDGKPLKIRWGVVGRVRGPSIPVIFEQEGGDPRRRVGFTEGAMQAVEEEEWERLWNADPEDFEATSGREEQGRR